MKRLALASLLLFSSNAILADELARYRDESRAIVGPFMQRLVAENRKAMMEDGPESAIRVCRDIAPMMSGEASRRNGLRLTRVSLKVRNPLLGMPDAWEQAALLRFESRLANGEKPEMLESAEIVSEPSGKFFRYMKGIVLQPGCIACHGMPGQITDNVKSRLAEEYPHDQATGYKPGQLRGGISIKRPL